MPPNWNAGLFGAFAEVIPKSCRRKMRGEGNRRGNLGSGGHGNRRRRGQHKSWGLSRFICTSLDVYVNAYQIRKVRINTYSALRLASSLSLANRVLSSIHYNNGLNDNVVP